jgi:hypothetical protein
VFVLVLPHCEEGSDFNSFYAGMRMHLKTPLMYWWCHIMYTLGTMCQSLQLRNTRFCGLPFTATTIHFAINKACVVGGGTYKAARNAEWGHVDKIQMPRVGSLLLPL